MLMPRHHVDGGAAGISYLIFALSLGAARLPLGSTMLIWLVRRRPTLS
jgi:hypothetical protein